MTPEEQERLNEICRRVIVEQNPNTFDELVNEMNDLLDAKYERIHENAISTKTNAGRPL